MQNLLPARQFVTLQMEHFPKALETLIHEFSRLPTIGRKSAQRLALWMLKADPVQAQQLAAAVAGLHEGVRFCHRCYFLAEANEELCAICRDNRRDQSVICVVEEPADVIAFEKSATYHGVYHVLLGRLAPLQGVMPDDLKIQELMNRTSESESPVSEVIIATSPSVDGDATALYIHKMMEKRGISTSRLGLGVPMGSTLEYVDELTLQKALEARRGF